MATMEHFVLESEMPSPTDLEMNLQITNTKVMT